MVYTGSQNFTSTGTRINDDVDPARHRRRDLQRVQPQLQLHRREVRPPDAHDAVADHPEELGSHATARGKFGPQVNPADGLSAAEARTLDAEQDAKTEASIDR